MTTQTVSGYNNLVVTLSKDEGAPDLRITEACKNSLEGLLKDWAVTNRSLWLKDLDMAEWLDESCTIIN